MTQRFSKRTGWDVGESSFAAAVREARTANAGRRLIDLTISNPTVCGFKYDAEKVLGSLTNPEALVYDPNPRGMRSAREAIAEYYAEHDAGAVDADALVLTTSTSEGYGYLFRLLCDAEDEVLVAQPSYPLFDFLADLEDVRLIPYPLFYDFGWWIDFTELERRIGANTRAIVLVHPNNPTGHATSGADRIRLEDICYRYGLALIVDEVFLDYPLDPATRLASFATGPHPTLTFVLSGMSKIAGLPHMKVGWIATFGPPDVQRQALDRLEVIADTFLSMNTPSQLALPVWLKERGSIRDQILQRTRANSLSARAVGIEVLDLQAGWSAIVRQGQRGGAGNLAMELLQEAAVIVHPGSFYGMAEGGRIVMSLIGPTADFVEGVRRLSEWNA